MNNLVARRLHRYMSVKTSTYKGRYVQESSPIYALKVSPLAPTGFRAHSTTRVVQANAMPLVDPVDKESVNVNDNDVKSRHEEALDRRLYKLDMDVRRTGRALYFELEKIVAMMEKSGVCTANQALLVLRCCGEVLVDLSSVERSDLVKKYLSIIKKTNVELDVSHYNAILKVHLENQNIVGASDFLAGMEEAGITPNRVTFQHLVGMYCMEGNMTGATTILEHMKAEDMAINEAVFISLLKGHCKNNDDESVKATIEVMNSMGLSQGADSMSAMACSYGLSGNWLKVQEVLSKVEEQDIHLDDGDYFSIILACSQGGLLEEAQSLISKLPKKRGYFQELRNLLPQIAMSGNVFAAVEIYLSLDDKEGMGRDQMGMFVVKPIAKSGSNLENMVEAVKQMEEAGFASATHFLVQEAAYSWSKQRCMELIELINKDREEGFQCNQELLFNFLRGSLQFDKNPMKIANCLTKLKNMDVNIPLQFVYADLIPAMLDLDNETPNITVKKLRDACPFLQLSFLNSMMMRSLLNNETKREFQEATGFMLFGFRTDLIRPVWVRSLAQAYVKTRSLDDLVTILFLVTRGNGLGNNKGDSDNIDVWFQVLNNIISEAAEGRPKVEPDVIITPVLEELIKHQIGVHIDVVKTLRKSLLKEETLQLLDKATELWENRASIWNQNEESRFLNERKKLFKDSMVNIRQNASRNKKNDYRGYFTVPTDLEQMEEIQSILASRGDTNGNLSDKLIQRYAEDGLIHQSLELIEYSQEKSKFNVSPSTMDLLVTQMVEKSMFKEALDLVEKQCNLNGSVYISSMMLILEGLAESGDKIAVLNAIEKLDISKFLVSKNGSYGNTLLNFYSKKGDVESLREVFDALLAKNIVSTKSLLDLNPLVEVHLASDDLMQALSEVKRINSLYKKMPKKVELACRLIENDNIDAIQELFDLSKKSHGEETAIYDLAFSFLQMNHRNKAKKLLEVPGLRFNQDKIGHQCSYLENNGYIGALEDLVSISKVIFGCDRDFMYSKLVSAFKDDADKILDVWLQMQEEGHVPSDPLKVEIAKALKAGNRELPFEEPSVRQRKSGKAISAIDQKVQKALDSKDIDEAVSLTLLSFEQGEATSLKIRRDVINVLIETNRIGDASNIAIKLANNFANAKKIRFLKTYKTIYDLLEDSKKQSFLSDLNPGVRERLEKLL